MTCPWCGAPIPETKRGAHVKQFCSTAHKTAYRSAAERFARAMLAPGRLRAWDAVSPSRATECGAVSGADDR